MKALILEVEAHLMTAFLSITQQVKSFQITKSQAVNSLIVRIKPPPVHLETN
jgi:hypothetical protein